VVEITGKTAYYEERKGIKQNACGERSEGKRADAMEDRLHGSKVRAGFRKKQIA